MQADLNSTPYRLRRMRDPLSEQWMEGLQEHARARMQTRSLAMGTPKASRQRVVQISEEVLLTKVTYTEALCDERVEGSEIVREQIRILGSRSCCGFLKIRGEGRM
jgi:hypothetical protein